MVMDQSQQTTTNLTPLKFCRDCKHLLGVRYNVDQAGNWLCVNEKNIIKKSYNLVTGKVIWLLRRDNCENSREDNPLPSEDICGPKGNWFEEYVKPDFISTGAKEDPVSPSKKKFDADSL